MISASRARAETKFAAIERRQQKALSEQETQTRAIDENTARLKALRLAREESERAEKEASIRSKAAKLAKRVAAK